ncbi:MAG TPA: hypothetical protein DD733_04900, partial [Clostridiales bacterium]|nr:hypothetical protein [Clostridiales bacterium]
QVPYSIIGKVVAENNGYVDGRTLFTALKRGCKVARDIFEDYLEMLSVGVLNIIDIFRPDMIVIGGGISKEGDTLLLPLREAVGECSTRIEISSLNDNAGIIGAALLYKK